MKFKLSRKIFAVAFMLAFSFTFSIFANADNKPISRKEDSASSSVATNDSSNISEDSNIEEEIDKALVGNANLIKEKKIIHDSSEMQFIAVTTKDEQVFYILIDYTATNDNKSGEGAVYFLNKVDSADLFAIANANSDNNATSELEYNDSLSEQTATENTDESSLSDEEDNEQVQPQNQKSNDMVFYIFLIIAAGVIIVVVYFIKIKPKKNAIKDDDEDDDFEMDDYEINEDEEKNT